MKLFNFKMIALSLLTAASAQANAIYDCYQGFDSFPNQGQAGLKPFFIIPVTDFTANVADPSGADRNKDKLMILNESGQQLMTVSPARATSASRVTYRKFDVFAFKPVGDPSTAETRYTTHLIHDIPDAGYFVVPGEDAEVDAEVSSENPNAVTKVMSEMDAKLFLESAAEYKQLVNQHQFNNSWMYRSSLRVLMVKKGINAVKTAYQNSLAKLDSCYSFGYADLSKAADDQKKLLREELKKVDEIVAADRPGGNIPQTSTPSYTDKAPKTRSASAIVE